MRTSAAKWDERIRTWRESGLSADDFAKSVGCRTKTLQWWASELDHRARGTKSAPTKVTMASVQVVGRDVLGEGLHHVEAPALGQGFEVGEVSSTAT